MKRRQPLVATVVAALTLVAMSCADDEEPSSGAADPSAENLEAGSTRQPTRVR